MHLLQLQISSKDLNKAIYILNHEFKKLKKSGDKY